MANLDESTYEAVNNSNFKAIAEAGALVANGMAQNFAAHQQAMNQVQQGLAQIYAAGVARAMRSQTELDPEEANSSRVVGSQLPGLAADVAAIQRFVTTGGASSS